IGAKERVDLHALFETPAAYPNPSFIARSVRRSRLAPALSLLFAQPQHPPLHFSGGGHRQAVREFDLLGIFVGRELAAHVLLQLRLQRCRSLVARREDDEGLHDMRALAIGAAYHRTVRDPGRHFPDLTGRYFVARFVDAGHAVSRIGPTDRPGLGRPQGLRIADDVVDLGLAEHLVDGDPERLAAPFEYRFTQRLAGAHDGAQRKLITLLRLRHRLHHHLERGRKEEAVAHAVLLHQPERLLGIEAAAV